MKIPISQVMTRGIETISSAATLEEAGKKMRTHNVGMLPVVDGEKLVGVVTDRDIVVRAVSARLRPEMTRVREVMTKYAITCYEDDDITKASFLMEKNLVHRLPVVNRDEGLVGVISVSDVATKMKSEALSGRILRKVSAA